MSFGREFLFWVKAKPGISKYGQTFMVFGVVRFYPCAYIQHYKLHPKSPPYIHKVPSEVCDILQKIRRLGIGEGQYPGDKSQKIYNSKQHIIIYNRF